MAASTYRSMIFFYLLSVACNAWSKALLREHPHRANWNHKTNFDPYLPLLEVIYLNTFINLMSSKYTQLSEYVSIFSAAHLVLYKYHHETTSTQPQNWPPERPTLACIKNSYLWAMAFWPLMFSLPLWILSNIYYWRKITQSNTTQHTMQVRAMYLPPVFYSTTHTCPRMKNILYLGFDRTIHIWKEEEKLVTRSAKHIEIEALLHP